MFTTRSRTRRSALGLVVIAGIAAQPLFGATVLVPIVAGAHGVNDALWSSEVRLTNRIGTPQQLTVIDWIGASGWRSATYVVPGHATVSVGGFEFAATPSEAGGAVVGVAVCSADEGLLVQTAILTGLYSVSLVEPCPSYDGGGDHCLGRVGAGPLVEGLAFTPSGGSTFVPWLHTDDRRRTNFVVVNPDSVPAHITLQVTSQDGAKAASAQFEVGARSLLQLNDLFAGEPWLSVRVANGAAHVAGASATITGNTRLLAIAYVISNDDNSLTVSLPR